MGTFHTVLAVPLTRDSVLIGVFVMVRDGGPRPFADKEIELVQTFADQAVIAIENVRLFDEVKARTEELTEFAPTANSHGGRTQGDQPLDL